jgi:hypothetical protein
MSDPMDMSGQKTARTELKLLARWRRRRRFVVILPNARRSSVGFGGCDSCCALGRFLKSASMPLHGLQSEEDLGMVDRRSVWRRSSRIGDRLGC